MKPKAQLGETAVTEAIKGAGFTVASFQEVKPEAKQEKGEQKQERKKKVVKAARYDVAISGMT